MGRAPTLSEALAQQRAPTLDEALAQQQANQGPSFKDSIETARRFAADPRYETDITPPGPDATVLERHQFELARSAESSQRRAQARQTAKTSEAVDARIEAEADTWADTGRKFLNRLIPTLKRQAGGMMQATVEGLPGQIRSGDSVLGVGGTALKVLDALGADNLIETMNRQLREAGDLPGQQLFKSATKDLEENGYNPGNSALKKYLPMIGEGAVQMVPAIAATFATKNPTIGTAVMLPQVFGDQYGESREMGRTVNQSMTDATFMAASEVIAEKIPLGMMMKPGGTFLKNTLKVAGAEALQEMFTEVLQTGYDMNVLNPDMTWGEAMQRVIDAGIVGGGVGGVMGGTGTAVNRWANRNEPAQPDVPLSEDDLNSPIPTDILQAGRNAQAQALDPDAAAARVDAFARDPMNAPAPSPEEAVAALNARRDDPVGEVAPRPITPRVQPPAPVAPRGDFVAQTAQVESGGSATARNPNSSATGAHQFINSTWLDLMKRHRSRETQGMSDEQILALRTNPLISAQMAAVYARENGAQLRRNGYAVDNGTLYLSHFLGAGGANSVLGASPSTPVDQLLTPGQIRANRSVLQGKTAGEVIDWAYRKMGGSAAQAAPLPSLNDEATASQYERESTDAFIARILGDEEGNGGDVTLEQASDVEQAPQQDPREEGGPVDAPPTAQEGERRASAAPSREETVEPMEGLRGRDRMELRTARTESGYRASADYEIAGFAGGTLSAEGATPAAARAALAAKLDPASFGTAASDAQRRTATQMREWLDAPRQSDADTAEARPVDQAAEIARTAQTPGRRAPRRAENVDFLTFIADRGGVRDDEGHSLSRQRNLQRPIAGAGSLIRRNGLSVDEIGELAHEAGYFTERPTEAEVLELLDRASFEKVYPLPAQADEAAKRDARNQDWLEDNARVDIDIALSRYAIIATPEEKDEILSRMGEGMTAEEAMIDYYESAAYSTLQNATDITGDDYDIPFTAEEIAAAPKAQNYGADPFQELDAREAAGEGGRGRAPSAEDAQPGTPAINDPRQDRQGAAQQVTVEDMPSGKSVIIKGATPEQLAAVRAALPEKVQPIENARLGGTVYSRKYRDRILAVLDDAMQNSTSSEYDENTRVSGMAGAEGSLSESQSSGVQPLRSGGDNGSSGMGERLPGVSGRDRAAPESAAQRGSDRRGQGLRAGERALGDADRAESEQTRMGGSVNAEWANDADDGLGEGVGGQRSDARQSPPPRLAGGAGSSAAQEQAGQARSDADPRGANNGASEMGGGSRPEGDDAANADRTGMAGRKGARPSVSENRIFTEDAAEKARAKLREMLNRMNSGLDPELVQAGITLAGYHIEKGARTFTAYTRAMVADLGDAVRPYLRGWYEAVRYYPGMETISTEMSSAAQIEQEVAEAATQDESPVAPQDDLSTRLRDEFIGAFERGDRFGSITTARNFAAAVTGRKFEPGTAEAKMLDEAIEAAVVQTARKIAAGSEVRRTAPKDAYARLVQLYGQQPKLTVRTSTSVEQQAYSTPVPLSYLASRLAGINQNTTVYEPSAGNGSLLIDARATYVSANELNEDRAAQLRALYRGAEITVEDATTYLPSEQKDVVIANPPFGPIRDNQGNTITFNVDGPYRTNEIDHAISWQALKAMKDDGRAVLIIGSVAKTAQSEKARSDAYNGKAKREFFFKLYGAYNVVDHFTVAGELYERQGAGWPVDVIVIEGRGKSAMPLPAARVPRQYASWDALEEVLENERGNQVARADGGPNRGDRGEGSPARRTDAGSVDAGRGSRVDRRDGIGADEQPDVVRNGPDVGQSARAGMDQREERGPEANADQGSNRPSRRDQRPVETAENARQVAYRPGSGAPAMGTLVPINMQTAVDDALADLANRVGSIDGFVADRLGYSETELFNRFGGEQVDAIALAIDNIERGAGFIIGDQTGIGKGRVVAAVIRYAIRQNRAPIFATEKPNLYKDMYRDMVDIGIPEMLGRDISIMMTDAAKTVPLDDDGNRVLRSPGSAAHNAALTKAASAGLSASGVDVLFTTYSQMQSIGGEETPRQRAIRNMARGAIVILDESHNAGGQGPQMMKPKKKEDGSALAPSRAEFVREIVGLAHGVFYSSATYAKRPDVMDLYAATDMRLAVDDISKLGEAIAKGGVPMQQIVASMLARSGQYLRRERSFDGIAYNTPQVPVDLQQYEAASAILKAIQTFSEDYVGEAAASLDDELKGEAESVSFDGSTGGAGAASTNFTAIMHNVIDQMLLAFKSQSAADLAIEAVRRGEKPVITVANTLESLLTGYAEDDGIRVGQQINITFADVFRRYLERSRWVTVRKPLMEKGEKGERVRLTDEQLGAAGAQMFYDTMNMIGDAGLDALPGSPIDAMISRIEEAGFKVAEITGRTLGINYRGGKAYLKARGAADKSIAGRIQSISAFNDGTVDVMLLNQSGATGLSLHASAKFKDQRKRRMIIAQAERNIDTHMQMLGRVHRTGQVVLPEYDQLVAAIPAEKRPASVLAKKMASLNANTTASRDSAVTAKDVPDFMNVYGDEVAARIMAEEPDIHDALGRPLSEEGESYATDGAMRKVTGRIPLLPLKQQEEIYERLETEYAELLANKEAAGENALEAKTFDLDARVEATVEAVPAVASNPSPFAAAVNVERMNIKRLGKPYPSERVAEMIDEGKRLAPNMDTARREGEGFMQAEIAKASPDAAANLRKRLGENKDRWNAVSRLVSVGQGVRLKTENGNIYGVVTSINRTGRPKNPLALGSWKATIALVDASRQITLPFSQIEPDTGGAAVPGRILIQRESRIGDFPIVEAFDRMQADSRENRHIITGNILAGFDFMSSRGQIINFTDSEGQVRQGILAPRGWDFEKHQQSKGVPLTDHRAIVDYLTMSSNGMTGKGRTGDISIILFPARRDMLVTVSRSKKAGGEFFLNRDLTRALGTDFVSSSSGMVARAPMENAGPALQVLLKSGVRFEVPGDASDQAKERAREVMQRYGARFSVVREDRLPLEPAPRTKSTGTFLGPRVIDDIPKVGTVIDLTTSTIGDATSFKTPKGGGSPVGNPTQKTLRWIVEESDEFSTTLAPGEGNPERRRDIVTPRLVEAVRGGTGSVIAPKGEPESRGGMTQAQRSELAARQQQGMARRGGQAPISDQEGGLFSAERAQGSLFSVNDDTDAFADERLSSEMEAIRTKLAAEAARMSGDRVVVSVVNRLLDDPRIAGMYFERVITVATDSPQNTSVTLDHEIVHALRDLGLFRDAEWTALSRAALADEALMADIRRRYPSLDQESQIEEAVSDLFARWKGDRRGFVGTALARIADFFDLIRRMVGRANVSADIMRAIERGDIGRRVSDGERGDARQMVAYHGTPHDFDQFSLDAIGTGEGVQAFGWGLYFAGRRELAEHYRDKLSRGDAMDVLLWKGNNPSEVVKALNNTGESWVEDQWDAVAALTRGDGIVARPSSRGGRDIDAMIEQVEREGFGREAAWLRRNRADLTMKPVGRVFEVDIPEDSELLDWDAPLSKQPEAVKKALANIPDYLMRQMNDTLDERMMNPIELDDSAYTGKDLYRMLAHYNTEIDGFTYGENTQQDASMLLKTLGIPGLRFLDGASRKAGEGTRNYVVFDDARISVLGKFSIPGPSTTRPRARVLDGLRRGIDRLIGDGSNITDRLDDWRTVLQDRMLPLLRTQQRIELESGKALPAAMNAYRSEELMSGKVGARLEQLSDNLVTPLFDTMKAENVSVEELETYLYARHAPERNARIAEINPEFQEGTGSGMSDAEATAIMERVAIEGKAEALERVAARVDAILKFAVDTRVEAGLLSEDEAQAWATTYRHYVPLRGMAEIEPESGGAERPRRGSGINIRGAESRRAFGRKSRADNILAYSLLQAEEAIVRAGTNEVGQAFYALAKANPDPDFWSINKISRKPVFNKKSGQVSYRAESRIAAEDADYTISLKIKGQERRVTLNRANPQAVRLAQAMRNLNGTQLSGVLRVMSAVNRFLSFVNTGLNPEFVITNAFRDVQTASINLRQFDKKGLTRRVLKDYPAALKGSISGAFKKDGGDWGKWYREFVDEGGRVYFNRVEDLNELQQRIEREFAVQSPGVATARRAATALFKFIENANIGVENAVRLSAYKNAREMGMTQAEAASLAKNLTVNFNRRGAWGVAMNSLYLFYNASVQGSVRLIQAMQSKRVRRVLYGAMVAGALIEMLNVMLSGDDEDGESYYDKISAFDKSRNIIVMIPGTEGRHIKIPLPYGYNVFFALGRAPVELARGRKWQDTGADLATTIIDSFNPIGGTNSLLNFISPTIADPIVDLQRNRDFADRPIMPEQSQFGPPTPDNQRYWASVNPHWRAVTDFLNAASGGDEVMPGAIDISPETLEHLNGVVTGAAGTFFIDRAGGLVEKVIAGEDVTTNDLPLIRKVVGQKPSWYDKAAYYSRVAEIEQVAEYVKDYRERGEDEAADALEERKASLLGLQSSAKRAKKLMRQLRKDRRELEARRADMTAAEYRAERKAIEDQEKAVTLDFNTEWQEAVSEK